MTFNAYLLDPAARTLAEVEISTGDATKSIAARIGCARIDAIAIDRTNTVYLDDDGLTDGLTCITKLEGFPNPLAGKLVIAGTGPEGEPEAPTLSADEIAKICTIHFPVFDPVFETINEPPIFGSRIAGFDFRFEKAKPTVIAPDATAERGGVDHG